VRLGVAGITALAIVVSLTPAAQAAFSGKNGRLVFTSTRAIAGQCDPCEPKIYTMNLDGTGVTRVDPAGSAATPERAPEWDPATPYIAYERGSRIATIRADGATRREGSEGAEPTWRRDGTHVAYTRLDVYTAWPSGADEAPLTDDAGCTMEEPDETFCTFYDDPSWSPRGVPVAYTRIDTLTYFFGPRQEIDTFSSIQGTDVFIPNAADPDWSPDASRIVFATYVDDGNPHRAQVAVSAPDGSGRTVLTGEVCASDPAWSPDGSKIVFAAGGGPCGGDTEIYVMNADGSNVVQITSNSDEDGAPSWEPIPINAQVRPKAARQIRASLVPLFHNCDPEQATHLHGPPLAHPSCSPPSRPEGFVTIGTPDSNGRPANSSGYVRLREIGEPPPIDPFDGDQADVQYELDVSDVRSVPDFSDYTGELQVEIPLRISDRFNSPSNSGRAATLPETTLTFAAPCTPTGSATIGSRCSISTTADAVLPGVIRENQRTVLDVGQLRVLDGGEDGDAQTTPNIPFLTQGVFIP
jgi:hypothetical protein